MNSAAVRTKRQEPGLVAVDAWLLESLIGSERWLRTAARPPERGRGYRMHQPGSAVKAAENELEARGAGIDG